MQKKRRQNMRGNTKRDRLRDDCYKIRIVSATQKAALRIFIQEGCPILSAYFAAFAAAIFAFCRLLQRTVRTIASTSQTPTRVNAPMLIQCRYSCQIGGL